MQTKAPHTILFGEPGTGKSHVLDMAKECLPRYLFEKVTNMSTLAWAVKNESDRQNADEHLAQVALFFDEMGKSFNEKYYKCLLRNHEFKNNPIQNALTIFVQLPDTVHTCAMTSSRDQDVKTAAGMLHDALMDSELGSLERRALLHSLKKGEAKLYDQQDRCILPQDTDHAWVTPLLLIHPDYCIATSDLDFTIPGKGFDGAVRNMSESLLCALPLTPIPTT
jgi:hypothetical protein